ncbi:MAG TPA: DNA alkylation repair protein [Enterococcus columbae]|nr:DNA alkylation repair protein [Enterococcus columbae]
MDKYQTIKSLFEKNSDKEKALPMAKYMKNHFVFYGISAADRKRLYKEFLKTEKKQQQVDWDFLRECYGDEHREFQYLAYDYLLAMKKFVHFEHIPQIKLFIMTRSWWDTVDFLSQVVGNIAMMDSRVDELMLTWSLEENIWIKRVAILYQLRFKTKTNPTQLKQIILNCLGTNEFFINKAIGWALREYSKVHPEWVRQFLADYQERLAKLSIREASKYL